MRSLLSLAGVSSVFSIVVACSSSSPTPSQPDADASPPSADGGASRADASPSPADDGGQPPAPPPACSTEWCAVAAPAPTTFRCAWSSGPSDVWIGGDGGVLLHFDGKTLAKVAIGTTEAITAIGGASATDVWIGTTRDQYSGTLFHGDGKTFTPITKSDYFFAEASYLAIWARTGGDVWFAKNTGGLIRKQGDAWVDSGATHDGAGYPDAIWGSSATDVWVADTYDARRFDGHAWTKNGAGATSLWGSGPSDVYATGGALARFDGAKWTTIALPAGVWAAAVSGTGATDVWVVGQDAHVDAAIVHGVSGTWTTSSVPAGTKRLVAVTAPAPGEAWAVGDGAILRLAK